MTYSSKKDALMDLLQKELPDEVTATVTEGRTEKSDPMGITRTFSHMKIQVCQFDDVLNDYTELGEVEDGERQPLETKIYASNTIARVLSEGHELVERVKTQVDAYQEAAAEKGL
jgi:hypothetical protein